MKALVANSVCRLCAILYIYIYMCLGRYATGQKARCSVGAVASTFWCMPEVVVMTTMSGLPMDAMAGAMLMCCHISLRRKEIQIPNLPSQVGYLKVELCVL